MQGVVYAGGGAPTTATPARAGAIPSQDNFFKTFSSMFCM